MDAIITLSSETYDRLQAAAERNIDLLKGQMTIERQDFRDLFKRFLGSGYFKQKSRELKVTRHTLSNILGGKVENPKILDTCLAELEERMSARAAAIERINHLTQTHKQLQSL